MTSGKPPRLDRAALPLVLDLDFRRSVQAPVRQSKFRISEIRSTIFSSYGLRRYREPCESSVSRTSGVSSNRRSAISTTLVSEQSQSNAICRTSRRKAGGKLTDSFFTPPAGSLALSRSIAALTVDSRFDPGIGASSRRSIFLGISHFAYTK
jgi:hypothetical protein